jgi:hypothetical protein
VKCGIRLGIDIYKGEVGLLGGDWRLVQRTSALHLDGEDELGVIRIIAVRQQHNRSGYVITLLDAESMGETRVKFRKRQFSYLLEGTTPVAVKRGNWILGPRDELGFILDVKSVKPSTKDQNTLTRVELRVRFNETGEIRIKENWQIFLERPLTHRLLKMWQKRMTDNAQQYFFDVLPFVIDDVLHKPSSGIDGTQIQTIRSIQTQILKRAIRLAEAQQIIRLTSTQLIRATRDVLEATSQV